MLTLIPIPFSSSSSSPCLPCGSISFNLLIILTFPNIWSETCADTFGLSVDSETALHSLPHGDGGYPIRIPTYISFFSCSLCMLAFGEFVFFLSIFFLLFLSLCLYWCNKTRVSNGITSNEALTCYLYQINKQLLKCKYAAGIQIYLFGKSTRSLKYTKRVYQLNVEKKRCA